MRIESNLANRLCDYNTNIEKTTKYKKKIVKYSAIHQTKCQCFWPQFYYELVIETMKVKIIKIQQNLECTTF